MELQVLKSTIDRSVNFVKPASVGFQEARYVRRGAEYFICYLSSQTGCNRGCQFCHLTTTGQTLFEDVDANGYAEQALQVMEHYKKDEVAKFVHYNFMARGEALANGHLIVDAPRILERLGGIAREHGLPAKFNISTIMPMTLKFSLVDVFSYAQPTIYYSLYSVSDTFRKKWLPAAMSVDKALRNLAEYQAFTGKRLKIHFAFIEGQNDSFADVMEMVDAIHDYKLDVDFNIVRYNPGDDTSKESSEEVIQSRAATIRSRIRGYVQIVPRVGFDVKASCGMFVSGGSIVANASP